MNPASDVNVAHIAYFDFIGRVIGMASLVALHCCNLNYLLPPLMFASFFQTDSHLSFDLFNRSTFLLIINMQTY